MSMSVLTTMKRSVRACVCGCVCVCAFVCLSRCLCFIKCWSISVIFSSAPSRQHCVCCWRCHQSLMGWVCVHYTYCSSVQDRYVSEAEGWVSRADNSVFGSADTKLSNFLLFDRVWTINVRVGLQSDLTMTTGQSQIHNIRNTGCSLCIRTKMQSVKLISQKHQGVIMRLLFGVKSPFTM